MKQRHGFPALSGVSVRRLEFPVCLTQLVCFYWVFPAHRIVINLFAFPADVAGL